MDANPETSPERGDIWEDTWGMSRVHQVNLGGAFQAEREASGRSWKPGGTERKCPKGCNPGGEMGLEVKLERRQAAGHCRGHLKGLGSWPIFREYTGRCYVDEFWDLFAFLDHLSSILWAKNNAVSIMGSSYKWVNWILETLVTCPRPPTMARQSWCSNPGLPKLQSTLSTTTLYCLFCQTKTLHCLQKNLILF